MLTPEGTLTPMGVMPRARSLRVAGIFQLGLYEFDSAYAVVSLPVGLRLMGKPYPDFLQLKVDDLYQAHARRRDDRRRVTAPPTRCRTGRR